MEVETGRKRKHSKNSETSDHEDPLALTLSPPSSRSRTPTPPPLLYQPHPNPPASSPPPPPPLFLPAFLSASSSSSSSASGPPGDAPRPPPSLRARRNPTQAPRDPGKGDTVPPPFPWATDRRAAVHSLRDLVSRGVTEVSGEAQCKRCESREVISYDLRSRFEEVTAFVRARRHLMHDRAPAEWMSPSFPSCRACGQPNSMRPVVAPKKRAINWLFMLLGQTLGCCSLEQLKYFCKHTKNHRTGAKDRVLYLTYLGLCKQLDPSGPYDR